MEIVLQFCIGSMDISEKYCDDFRVISAQYISSFSGFWFDVVTSIPWSFNDLYAYQVSMLLARSGLLERSYHLLVSCFSIVNMSMKLK